ncbi:LuxR C-terminal-related transcriptional regulator [Pseudooceanicola nanhaiensis]|uniref:LuxR C-terminal-related transcriptional regulator n=1 Tax=Pseudooceanicola nanhaiensis TaxID=375761 RepID=UPI001CD22728|nr:LuxR C-terminal-related transcriptional regulator [Pseudooceanicola nanhaiensis]MCA0921116.1 LuxR C-terminal-related transcriptional regulator [Pseudooceanicola nanhaiensis]
MTFMTMEAEDAPSYRLQDEILDRLYAVAEDPALYDGVLDAWNRLVAPLQAQAPGWSHVHVPGPDFAAHFARLTRLLGSDRVQRRPREDHLALSRITVSIAFTLDAALRISAMNAAADGVLSLPLGTALRDFPLLPEDCRALAAEVRLLLASPDAQARTLRIRHPRTFGTILLNLRPVFPDPERQPPGTQPRPDYVMVVTSLLRWPESHADMMQTAFGLTPAEYAVLRSLAAGQSVNEIATQRGRSVQTVRAQVKALQQKTETRSQPELVRLTLSTVETAPPEARLDHQPRVSRGIHLLEDRLFRVLRLPDGRRMEYLEFGDPAGRPVLYSPGLITLCRWPAEAEAAAAAQGLRVIVPLRAGFGGSCPLPPEAPRGETVAQDLAALIDALELDRVSVLCQHNDLYFIALLHGLRPGCLDQVVGLAALLPLCCAEQYTRMARWPRFIQSSARYTPDLLPDMVRGTFAMSRCIGKLPAMRLFFGASADDLGVLQAPETQEAITVGTEATMSRERASIEAFIDDVIATHGCDWSAELRSLLSTVPVTVMYGDQDSMMPPETVANRAAAFPGARYITVAGTGQLLFFSRWRDILPLFGNA